MIEVLNLSITNCFLLKSNQSYVLVDTGYEYDWELFSKQLTAKNIEISQISHLILTHHHDDHCGLINNLIQQNNSIRLVFSSHAVDLLSKGENDKGHGGGYINKRIYCLSRFKKVFDKRWTLTFPPYKIRANDIIITKQIRLSDIGINIDGTIIETPGHSIDSISILLDNGDCIVGGVTAIVGILWLSITNGATNSLLTRLNKLIIDSYPE